MVVEEYIEFSKKNIFKYLKLILEKYYDKEIAQNLVETYINIRYYNTDQKTKNLEKNINYYLKQKVTEILDEEKEEKIKIIFYVFKYILYFDNVKEYEKNIIEEIVEYRKSISLENNGFKEEITKLIKENEKRKQKYLEAFKSDHFLLDQIKTNKKNVYFVELKNNIKFNKIYSSYSINKVYNSGLVNEQKDFIIYYQISIEILKNAIIGNFNQEYIVDFPLSIFKKKQKTIRLFDIINNEMIKNNLILKLTYSSYLENKEQINEWIKEGYKVAIIIDEKYNYEEKEKMWLEIFNYVIVEQEKKGFFDDEKIIIK